MSKTKAVAKRTSGARRAPAKRNDKGYPSIVATMAERWAIDPATLQAVVLKTCLQGSKGFVPQPEHVAVFLMIAREYDLNPMMGEIHAFVKEGAVHPIVGIDGRLSIINGHPQFDGLEATFLYEDGRREALRPDEMPLAVEVSIWRKDRTRPTTIVETMAECKRDTIPWRQHPRRMLRHKGIIQCARVAFALRLYDQDEWDQFAEAEVIDGDAVPSTTTLELHAGPDRIPHHTDEPDAPTTATPSEEYSEATVVHTPDDPDTSQSRPLVEVFADEEKKSSAPKAPKPAARVSPASRATGDIMMRSDITKWSREIAGGDPETALAFVKEWSSGFSGAFPDGFHTVSSIPKSYLRGAWQKAHAAITDFKTPMDGESTDQESLL